jgi:hypothetical protein
MINNRSLPIEEGLDLMINFANSELLTCKDQTEVSTAQISSDRLKDLKIVLADLQKEIGSVSTEARQHVGSLRLKSPKRKPEEDDLKTISGVQYIFLGNVWYPLSESLVKDK